MESCRIPSYCSSKNARDAGQKKNRGNTSPCANRSKRTPVGRCHRSGTFLYSTHISLPCCLVVTFVTAGATSVPNTKGWNTHIRQCRPASGWGGVVGISTCQCSLQKVHSLRSKPWPLRVPAASMPCAVPDHTADTWHHRKSLWSAGTQQLLPFSTLLLAIQTMHIRAARHRSSCRRWWQPGDKKA